MIGHCWSHGNYEFSLNALSGIGGVRTELAGGQSLWYNLCLNALSGIGGVRTTPSGPAPPKSNTLS